MDSRPKGYGWSLGELKLFVGGQQITASRAGKSRHGVRWYLSPVLHWLTRSWAPLFHEERFPWGETVSMPGNLAIASILRRLIAETDEKSIDLYGQAKAWWGRHSLASLDDGGLWPDICFRRFGDLVEVSWSNKPPLFAPIEFEFEFFPAQARLPVNLVADPLWRLLGWSTSQASLASDPDFSDIHELREEISEIRRTPTDELARWYAPSRVIEFARKSAHTHDDKEFLFSSRLVHFIPVIEALSPAVAMFGAVSPETTSGDVQTLTELLLGVRDGGDSEALQKFVTGKELLVGQSPANQGYELARDFAEQLEACAHYHESTSLDPENLCRRFSVSVTDRRLETETIRGLAIAGQDVRPTIVINSSHPYNLNPRGKRFTIAHELCHILYDRGRARRITHVSTPWTNPAIEKRANAFAAMLLMPPSSVLQALGQVKSPRASLSWARELADWLGTSIKSTIEHLYNLHMISLDERELLRDEYDLAIRP
jgi:Zn-dependent peptidase ImmA (M78 family)